MKRKFHVPFLGGWGAVMLPRLPDRCHQHADTYRSSHVAAAIAAVAWGKWLICGNPLCEWNGARDYAAALNLARLGGAFLNH